MDSSTIFLYVSTTVSLLTFAVNYPGFLSTYSNCPFGSVNG